jgi:hypothetical protein
MKSASHAHTASHRVNIRRNSATAGPPVLRRYRSRRRIMKALIAALAMTTLIAVSTFAPTANAAPMSPASSSFGSNGY